MSCKFEKNVIVGLVICFIRIFKSKLLYIKNAPVKSDAFNE